MSEPAAGARAPSKRRRDARVRLLVAPLVLLVVLAVLWVHDETGSSIGTYLLLALFAAAAGAEMALLLRGGGRPARPLEAAVGCALLCLVPVIQEFLWFFAPGFVLQPLVLMGLVVYVLLAHLRDVRPEALESIGFRLVPLVYVGYLLSFMGYWAEGARWIAYLVLVAKASDMAGWLIGVPLGRHKMLPSVSPAKSWEGTVGGVAASVLVAVFLPRLLDVPYGWSAFELACFGLVVGAASVVSGLLWSGWKRRLGAKDSSALIPEMGGVMDMVDSLLLAGPAAFLWDWIRLLW